MLFTFDVQIRLLCDMLIVKSPFCSSCLKIILVWVTDLFICFTRLIEGLVRDIETHCLNFDAVTLPARNENQSGYIGFEFPSQHDEFVVQKSSIRLNYRTPKDFYKINLMILHHITQSKL